MADAVCLVPCTLCLVPCTLCLLLFHTCQLRSPAVNGMLIFTCLLRELSKAGSERENMSKTLQQITFDFSSEEEKEIKITGHDTPVEQVDIEESLQPLP